MNKTIHDTLTEVGEFISSKIDDGTLDESEAKPILQMLNLERINQAIDECDVTFPGKDGKEKRYGTFRIPRALYDSMRREGEAQEILWDFIRRGVIIMDVNDDILTGVVAFTAIWSGFEPVQEGGMIPEYKLNFETDGEGRTRFMKATILRKWKGDQNGKD